MTECLHIMEAHQNDSKTFWKKKNRKQRAASYCSEIFDIAYFPFILCNSPVYINLTFLRIVFFNEKVSLLILYMTDYKVVCMDTLEDVELDLSNLLLFRASLISSNDVKCRCNSILMSSKTII